MRSGACSPANASPRRVTTSTSATSPRTAAPGRAAGRSRRASSVRAARLRSQRGRHDPRRAGRARLHPLGARAHRRRPPRGRTRRPASPHRLRQGPRRPRPRTTPVARSPKSCSRRASPPNSPHSVATPRSLRSGRIGDPASIAPQIPIDLLDELTATGTPEQVIASLTAIAEAGVDSIAFAPIGPNPDEQLRLLAQTIAPALRS